MSEKQEKLIFPQNFDIKVIVAASIPIEESKANISQVFNDCKTVHSFVSARSSAKGRHQARRLQQAYQRTGRHLQKGEG